MASFTGRDLALLLPDKLDVRNAEGEKDLFEPLKPKVDQSKKVTRYFPGKAPTWVGDESRSSNQNDDYVEVAIDRTSSRSFQVPVVEDRRLARLTKSFGENAQSSSRRRIFEAEVVEDGSDEEFEGFLESKNEEGSRERERGGGDYIDGDVAHKAVGDDGGENEVAERRARVLKKLAEKQHEQTLLSRIEVPDPSESEYETDTDEEEEEEAEEIMRPIFIPKAKRETIKEQELKMEEMKLRDEKKLIQDEDRKRQTRVLVAESIRRNIEMTEMSHTDADSDAGLPDDSDDLDDEMEYESWKVREMRRLMRDAEQREFAALEKADLERRRLMTDEQRINEDKRLGLGKYGDEGTDNKAKWGFMQKYYHKGVFYMDEDSLRAEGDVRKNDFNEPTLDDKFDKEKLPAVLQVKNFGKRGRTKYTHLADQDTTKFKERLQVDEKLQKSYLDKRCGVGSLDNAGRIIKKSRDDDI